MSSRSFALIDDVPRLPRRLVSLRSSHRAPLAFVAFSALIILSLADFSQDYAYFMGQAYRDLVPGLHGVLQALQSGLIALGIMLGVARLLRGRVTFQADLGARLFLVLFTLMTIIGVLVGIAKGVALQWVLGDSQNILIYLIVLGIPSHREVTTSRLKSVAVIAMGAVILKVGLAVTSDLIITGAIDWRYYLKASAFLPAAALAAFALRAQTKDALTRRRLLIFAVLALGGVFLAQARGIFLGTFAGFAALAALALVQRKAAKIVLTVGTLFLVIGIGIAATRNDFATAFGRWTTEDATAGSQYRVRQFSALMDMFRASPIVGQGLGAFDPNYEGYEEWLPRPYLVELEYVNLLAKTGVVGCTLLVAAFASLLWSCARRAHRAPSLADRGLIAGLAAGLVALLVESISQTMYSSVLFHLYVAFVLLTLSASRQPARTAAAPA